MEPFTVFVMMTFRANSKTEADEKAYNALSLIPKGEEPENYEVVDTIQNEESERCPCCGSEDIEPHEETEEKQHCKDCHCVW